MTSDTEQILAAIESLSTEVKAQGQRLAHVETKVDKLETTVVKLENEFQKFAEIFANYRQASQQVVNLAFGLIASATVITIVSAVFKR